VRQGDLLGEIIDVLGQSKIPVIASQDGLVLFLRYMPTVHQGDGLGGSFSITSPGKVNHRN